MTELASADSPCADVASLVAEHTCRLQTTHVRVAQQQLMNVRDSAGPEYASRPADVTGVPSRPGGCWSGCRPGPRRQINCISFSHEHDRVQFFSCSCWSLSADHWYTVVRKRL